MTTTEMAIDRIFAEAHILRIEPVPDGSAINYAVICSCNFLNGEFVYEHSAQNRLKHPCEIEMLKQTSDRRLADIRRRQAA